VLFAIGTLGGEQRRLRPDIDAAKPRGRGQSNQGEAGRRDSCE
jgi:hypothetical protein